MKNPEAPNLILHEMANIETGDTLFNCLDVRQPYNSVLYTELSAENVKDRLQSLHIDIDPDRTMIYNRNHFGDIGDYRTFFSKHIEWEPTPRIIYIDNISSWFGLDVNKDREMIQMHDLLKTISKDCNCCIIPIGHTRKKPNSLKDLKSKRSLEDFAGSRLLYALAEAAILFDECIKDGEKMKGWGRVDFFKKRDLDEVYYELDQVHGSIVYHEKLPNETFDVSLSTQEEAIYDFITRIGRSVTRQDIEAGTGLAKKTVLKALNALMPKNLIGVEGSATSHSRKYSVKKDIGVELMNFCGDIPLVETF
jgi:hypothetical protein